MLDMLKRIQEMGEDDLDDPDEDPEHDALAALAGLDLGKLRRTYHVGLLLIQLFFC